MNYHLGNVNYNEAILLDYANKTANTKLETQLTERIRFYQNETFLSKILFYEFVTIEKPKQQ